MRLTWGWLLWNTMLVLAALALAVLAAGLVLLVWFMFEVGFAWIAILAIGLALLLVLFPLKNLWSGRRSQ
jgi:hypothetical protein